MEPRACAFIFYNCENVVVRYDFAYCWLSRGGCLFGGLVGASISTYIGMARNPEKFDFEVSVLDILYVILNVEAYVRGVEYIFNVVNCAEKVCKKLSCLWGHGFL